ncbi:MAG: bifunctional 4-hydroxy-2-oxoglutarate aldolase/2-dehydro-3-deoxy-phosphogluconate aldolase [Gemmatimonadaceae bacterium]
MTSLQTRMSVVLAQFRQLRIVPVIVMDDPSSGGALGAALATGGLPCAEVTFRTSGAAEGLRRLTSENPGVLAGAGTVRTPAQAAVARDAGAQFIVAPGLSPAVVEYCQAHELPVFPGVCTPTEIEAALALGLTTLKFFPAEPMGGLGFLKAIAAPYADVSFIPTGGLTADNIGTYLAFDGVVACGGSWMAPREWIAAAAFDRIRTSTQQAVAAAQAARGRTA